MAVPVGMPDHALLTRARDGDGEAFEALYRRHHRAATRAAHSYSSRTQLAEDAVQEAFLRILHATQEGGGPQTEFRAYLATTVRHVIAGWTRGERTVVSDDLEMLAGEDVREGSRPESRLHWHLLTRAFKSLPTRWQEALWLGEVEGISPAELADRWNMSPNSAAALCYRARDGLRTAWLDAHVNEGLVPDGCRPYVTDLSRYTQGKLTDRRETQVRSHLEDCEYCRAVLFEVDVAASELRVLLLPVALWGGLALASGGAAVGLAGVLQGVSKTVGNLGTRGLAVGAGAAVTVVAVVAVVVAVAMSSGAEPGAADPTAAGTDTNVTDPTGSSGDDASDDADQPGENGDGDAASDEPVEPADYSSDPPADDPTSVPSVDPGGAAPGATPTVPADSPPSGDDPTDEPTTPATVPPGTDPTEDPEPTDEPAAPDAPEMDYTIEEDSIVLFGRGEPGATITVQPAGAGATGGGGGGATGRSVMTRVPMDGSGTVLATATVGGDGTWTATPDVDDVVGLRITATQTTTDGRVSAVGATIDIPNRPAVPAQIGVSSTGTSVQIEGTGAPGSMLRIHHATAGILAESEVSSAGSWTVRLALTPELADSEVWASQLGVSGLSSGRSPAFPLPPFSPPPEPELMTLTLSVEVVDGELVFTGAGHPGADVTVAAGDTVIATAVVDDLGAWQAVADADPSLSGMDVIATQTVGEATSQSEPVTVPEVDEPVGPVDPPAAPTVDFRIVFGNYANLVGTGANAAQIVVRTPEGDRVGGSSVDEDFGTWNIGILDDRIAGEGLTVVVSQIVDGVESPPSAPIFLRSGGLIINESESTAQSDQPDPSEPTSEPDVTTEPSPATESEPTAESAPATEADPETVPEEPTTADATETAPAEIPDASEEAGEVVVPVPPAEDAAEEAISEEPSEDVTASDN